MLSLIAVNLLPYPQQAIEAARHLLNRGRIRELPFHNYSHTAGVVKAARYIGQQESLSLKDWEVLLIAAWFHDTGLSIRHEQHESLSQEIAEAHLTQFNYPADQLKRVLDCIAATQMPQTPKTLIEQVLCDADLFHLSQPAFFDLLPRLRQEWLLVWGESYPDEVWKEKNIQFLQSHHYFTTIGKSELAAAKQQNLIRLIETKASLL